MLCDLNLSGNDFKLSPHFSAHLMQRAATRGTDLLLFWKAVFYRLHGQVRKDSLAPTLLFLALIGDFLDRRFSQKRLSLRLNFVEEPQLLAIRLFAGSAEATLLAQAELLFIPLDFGG